MKKNNKYTTLIYVVIVLFVAIIVSVAVKYKFDNKQVEEINITNTVNNIDNNADDIEFVERNKREVDPSQVDKKEKVMKEKGFDIITTFKDGHTEVETWGIVNQSTYTIEDAIKVAETLADGGYTDEDNKTYDANGKLIIEGPKDAVLIIFSTITTPKDLSYIEE